MNNRIKFGSHMKLSVCLLTLLMASESLGIKEGETLTADEGTTATSLKKRSFKDTLSILRNDQHAEHKAVKNSLATPGGFKDCTQDFSLSNVLKLAEEKPEYKAFTVISLLGNNDKDRAKHAGTIALEIFKDAGAAQHHEITKKALLAHFQTAPERVLPLEHVEDFMARDEALHFFGPLYLFKSDDAKKHDVGFKKLKEFFSNFRNPNHDQVKNMLDSSERFQENLKKLSKEKQDELMTLFNQRAPEATTPQNPENKSRSSGTSGIPQTQQDTTTHPLHQSPSQQSQRLSGDSRRESITSLDQEEPIAAETFQRPNGPIHEQTQAACIYRDQEGETYKRHQPRIPRKNQVDFSELLEKIPDIKENQEIFVKRLKNLPPDAQNALSQHLEDKNLTCGYELSQALGSFKNGESSLKNDLAIEAWIADPQY